MRDAPSGKEGTHSYMGSVALNVGDSRWPHSNMGVENPSRLGLQRALAVAAGDSARPTKLTALRHSGTARRPSPDRADLVTMQTALERHKPSTKRTYDTARRLARRLARLQAEGLERLPFNEFRLLAWDLGHGV